jgi:hypothetical protein
MLKRLFYLLPDFVTSIITRFSYRFYNNELEDFINNNKYGKYFNITRSQRIYILKRLKFSFSRINSATSLEVQLKLIKEILNTRILLPEIYEMIAKLGEQIVLSQRKGKYVVIIVIIIE